MPDQLLAGCRTVPLAGYLKGLGVLRLVGEQADVGATAAWSGEGMRLQCALDREALLTFFAERYQSTPLVAPWNGGSGFGPKDRQDGIAAIEASVGDRLAPFRQAIAVGRTLRKEADANDWNKWRLMTECRAKLPDEALAWLDAVSVLPENEKGNTAWPPLLGTGGNDGRFEFSNNYMQRLVDVMGLAEGRRAPGPEISRAWLRGALFNDDPGQLRKASVGQFDPAAAGPPGSSTSGSAESLVNPWDWVLLLEGALMFAGAAARRLSASAKGKAAIPFTVDASSVGVGSSWGSEDARGEVWLPVWEQPASAGEIAHLIGEGRAEWAGKQARRSVDIARAVTSLGVDRGVASFERYAIATRFGRNMLAVPVGSFKVSSKKQIPVLASLDSWLERVRRASDPPAAVPAQLHEVERAMFEVARAPDDSRQAGRLMSVLVATAALEDTVARASRFRTDNFIHPISRLMAREWLPLVDDGSVEFVVASGLCSQFDAPGKTLRPLLRPVLYESKRNVWEWTDNPPAVAGLGTRPLAPVLADALADRVMLRLQPGGEEAPGDQPDGEADAEASYGVHPAFTSARRLVPPWVVARFLDGAVDMRNLERYVSALLLLDPWRLRTPSATSEAVNGHTPVAFTLLAPFFHRGAVTPPGAGPDVTTEGRIRLAAEPSWPRQLQAGRVAHVLEAALRRLRIAGIAPVIGVGGGRELATTAPDGGLLAASLLLPLSKQDLNKLMRVMAPQHPDDSRGGNAQ